MDENGSGLLIELSRLGQVEGGKLQVALVFGVCWGWVLHCCTTCPAGF